MTEYESSWYRYRMSKISELIDLRPILSIEDTGNENDRDLVDLTDQRIFYSRNMSQVYISISTNNNLLVKI